MEFKITQNLIDEYIKYVYVYRVKSGYKAISEIDGEKEDEIKNKYKNGGIQKWLANKLHLTLEELGTLESNDVVLKEKEKINKWFEKYSNKKSSTKPEFFKFESWLEFYNWYKEKIINDNSCCYCGIKEKDLEIYFNKQTSQYFVNEDDKARQRGKVLELERIVTAPKEKNIYSKDNCALACYICNNAKSDFLSAKSFKPIAKGINVFWNKVIHEDKNLSDEELFNKIVKFPDTDIWEKE